MNFICDTCKSPSPTSRKRTVIRGRTHTDAEKTNKLTVFLDNWILSYGFSSFLAQWQTLLTCGSHRRRRPVQPGQVYPAAAAGRSSHTRWWTNMWSPAALGRKTLRHKVVVHYKSRVIVSICATAFLELLYNTEICVDSEDWSERVWTRKRFFNSKRFVDLRCWYCIFDMGEKHFSSAQLALTISIGRYRDFWVDTIPQYFTILRLCVVF